MLEHQTNGKAFLFDKIVCKSNPNLKTTQASTAVNITASREQEKDL